MRGFAIHRPGPEAREGEIIADRRLYIDRKGRLVEEDSPDAAFLLAAKGQPIPASEVRRLGLDIAPEITGESQDVAPVGRKSRRAR